MIEKILFVRKLYMRGGKKDFHILWQSYQGTLEINYETVVSIYIIS